MLSKDDIAALFGSLPADKRPADIEACAKFLVREKKLTVYQVQKIYAGKGSALVLGNYVIEDEIGQGGMGQVFKARHKRMDRLVAVKLLPPEVYKDESVIKRFHREVKAAAKLTHPHIVMAYDADEASGGIQFLVMEYIEGRDLARVLHEERHLSVERVVNYMIQAAHGLAYAHSKGIVHRDIKPANLLLDLNGIVKILDMGLVCVHETAAPAVKHELTKSGDVMGTIDYMAPEQAFDTHTVDGRADIYSLGCTLYRLLTGQNLYEGETIVQRLMAHQSKPIPSLRQSRPDVSVELEAVYQRMVAKKVDDRYQNMNDVIGALETIVRSDADSSFVYDKSKVWPNTQPTASINSSPTLEEPTSQFQIKEQVAVVSSNADGISPTVALSQSTQATDPVSEPSIASARTMLPTLPKHQPPIDHHRNRSKFLVAGMAGSLLLVFGAWIVIKDKNGKEVARVQVPDGGTVETSDTKPYVPPVTESPSIKTISPTATTDPSESPNQLKSATSGAVARSRTDAVQAIPAKALTFDGHRYLLVPTNDAMTWDEAKEKAEAMGGHLATITSQAEYDWVLDNIILNKNKRVIRSPNIARVFMGAIKTATDPEPKWITGEATEFRRWVESKPARSNSAKDSVVIWNSEGLTPYYTRNRLDAGSFLVEWDTLDTTIATSNP